MLSTSHRKEEEQDNDKKIFENYEDNFLKFEDGDISEFAFLEFTVTRRKSPWKNDDIVKANDSVEPVRQNEFMESSSVDVSCLDISVVSIHLLSVFKSEELKRFAGEPNDNVSEHAELIYDQKLFSIGKTLLEQGAKSLAPMIKTEVFSITENIDLVNRSLNS